MTTKAMKEIQQTISKAYKLGVCDIDGNSYTSDTGEVKKTPRKCRRLQDAVEASAEDTALEKLRKGWVPCV